MDLVGWKRNGMFDPISEFGRLQDEINQLFDFDQLEPGSGLFDRTMSPALDVLERDDSFVIHCDIPGVAEQDVEVSIAGNVLTIKGEKRRAADEGVGKIYRHESWAGSFQRTLSLPREVAAEKIAATLKNGVLTVSLPKREEVKPKQISVAVH